MALKAALSIFCYFYHNDIKYIQKRRLDDIVHKHLINFFQLAVQSFRVDIIIGDQDEPIVTDGVVAAHLKGGGDQRFDESLVGQFYLLFPAGGDLLGNDARLQIVHGGRQRHHSQQIIDADFERVVLVLLGIGRVAVRPHYEEQVKGNLLPIHYYKADL